MLESPPDERALLAAIAQYGSEAYVDIKDVVTENSFTQHVNRCIFVAYGEMFRQNATATPDTALILSSAKSIGLEQELASSLKYITALFNYHVELDNARQFAVKLRKLEEFRSLLGRLDETATTVKNFTGTESISEAVSIVEKPVFDFTAKLMCGNEQVRQIGDGIDTYYEYIKSNQDELDGVKIGCPVYEKHVGGIRTGLHIIGARKKTGKSYFALNSCLHACIRDKCPTLFLDTELHLEQGQWDRFIARLGSGLTVDEIKYGTFLQDEEKVEKFEKAISSLKRIPLQYVNITGRSIEEIISIIRRWLVQNVGYNKRGRLNKCLVVYDYLKPPADLKSLGQIKEHQEMGVRVDALHSFTAKYNFPILTFVQLNRDYDVAIADRISWYCTSYSSFHVKTPEEIAEDGPMAGNRKLVLEDLRFGEGLEYGDYINYQFDGKISLVKELKTRNQFIKEKDLGKDEED